MWPQTLACFILIAGALRVDFLLFLPYQTFLLSDWRGSFLVLIRLPEEKGRKGAAAKQQERQRREMS